MKKKLLIVMCAVLVIAAAAAFLISPFRTKAAGTRYNQFPNYAIVYEPGQMKGKVLKEGRIWSYEYKTESSVRLLFEDGDLYETSLNNVIMTAK